MVAEDCAMVDFNSVLNDARQLTEEDQLRLIDALFGPHPTSDELDEARQAEIERRVARMEAGKAEFVPWEKVSKDARRRIEDKDVN